MRTDEVLGLFDPLVAADASLVMLDGVVDVVLRFAVKVGQLLVGKDAQRIEFLFAVRADALDGLEVVGVLLGCLANALEIKGFLSLLDAVHGALLGGLCLSLVSHDGDVPEEVHAGLAQLDASGVCTAFVGREFTVVELEVDDHLPVLANRQSAGTFHAEGRLVHREAAVVVFIVEVNHVNADIAHVGDGDLLDGRFGAAGLNRPNRSQNERVVLGTRTCCEVRFSEGVLGLGAIREQHQQAVASEQQRDDEQQQQEQQAREAPHPIDAVILGSIAS